VGLPLQEPALKKFFNDDYTEEYGENAEGDKTVNAWDFCYWLRNEQFHKQQDKPSVTDFVEIMFDTVDTNDDGVVTYFDMVEYVKFYLDTLAAEGKIVRDRYPDDMVEYEVASWMNQIYKQEAPEITRDQTVWALTQGKNPISSYEIADILVDVFAPAEGGELQRSDVQS
jgi:hypothetical protein